MNIRQFCRGVICGGLMGDCYGYVFEDKGMYGFKKPMELLEGTLNGTSRDMLIYTDDSQMGLAILRSLRQVCKLDPSHLAKEHTEDFLNDGSHRYYGGNIGHVFVSLQKDNYKRPFKFAAEQFAGTGSYGNGGAMRVSPLAVYGLNCSSNDFDKLVVDAVRLTHTHPLGVCGALLQSFAVCEVWALVSRSKTPQLDPNQFLDNLLTRLSKVTHEKVDFVRDPMWQKALDAYRVKFGMIKQLLSSSELPAIDKVVETLGNDLLAINSVPLSIYAFLRSLKPISGIPYESIPLRCLIYTIGLGGDTDSNACMACSLAGGFVGLDVTGSAADQSKSSIPPSVLARCERVGVFEEYIDWLGKRLAG